MQFNDRGVNTMVFNRTHLILLSILSKAGAVSAARAITTEDIEKFCSIGKSYTTLHRAIHFLCKGNYISIGVKDGKFNTYYINSTGVEKLKEML